MGDSPTADAQSLMGQPIWSPDAKSNHGNETTNANVGSPMPLTDDSVLSPSVLCMLFLDVAESPMASVHQSTGDSNSVATVAGAVAAPTDDEQALLRKPT